MTKFEAIEHRIMTRESIYSHSNMWRFQSQKIVFTNGCFDIIHPGHVEYLCKAADLGNILVVGINSDESVRRLKGNTRPLIPEKYRAFQIAALHFVNAVVIFDEDTPQSIIEVIKPDILVKGADYNPDTIVGADFVKSYGGEVKTIELVEGFSTSALIEKIKML